MLISQPHLLAPDPPHYAWDNSLLPRLRVADGETVSFQTRDASDLHFRLDSTPADLATYEFRGHPLTGPVLIEGARAGDVLQVDVLEVQPDTFGWTAVLPGYGLLAGDFPEPSANVGSQRRPRSAAGRAVQHSTGAILRRDGGCAGGAR